MLKNPFHPAPSPASHSKFRPPGRTPSGQDALPTLAALGLLFLAGCNSGLLGSEDAASNAGGSQVNFGGAQDVGLFRDQLANGLVPAPESFEAPGFFAEHHIAQPPPQCGERLCLQPMTAVMGNLLNGANCTMLHLGLNSPLAADPGARPPLSLAVVVDTSGSMAGETMTLVQRGLGLLIDSMRDGDQLALIQYSDGASVHSPMTPVADHRVELRRDVANLFANGGTNLWAGLQAGYREVVTHYDAGRQNRVILISDGVPTVGRTGVHEILTASADYNRDGIGLTTIGLGTDFNVELMRGLSEQADGNFYYVENVDAVDEVFAEELSFFVVPIAFDLELTLRAGEHYRFGRAYGATHWRNTADGGTLRVPSAFLAHRDSDTDVTEAGGRRGGGSSLIVELMPQGSSLGEKDTDIAVIDLSFRDPTTGETVHDTVRLNNPLAVGELPRRGFFRADDLSAAHKSFVMLNIFVGVQNALGRFAEGTADDVIVQELDSLIAAVRDYNEEIDDRDIAADLVMLDQLRTNLVNQGVSSGLPIDGEDAWPVD